MNSLINYFSLVFAQHAIYKDIGTIRVTGRQRRQAHYSLGKSVGQWANFFFLFQTFYKIKRNTKIQKRRCRK
jgi:hypothetical protein